MTRDVAVIIPAYNAASHLLDALKSLDGQAHVTEICVACYDSQTRAVAHSFTPADAHVTYTVIDNPSGTTPDALNAALAHTTASFVARLDAHATFTHGYLLTAVEVLSTTDVANVGGIQRPTATLRFQRGVAAALASVAGSGGVAYRVGTQAKDVDTVYLGVFRRDALVAVGGFNPACLRNQDAELNIRLRQAGFRVRFDPRLIATYTPRSTVAGLARQYYAYGRWRRFTHKRTGEPFGLRQLLLPALLTILTGSVTVALLWLNAWFLLPVGGYGMIITAAGLHAAVTHPATRMSDTLNVIMALAVMHLAWGSGFMRGAPKKDSR